MATDDITASRPCGPLPLHHGVSSLSTVPTLLRPNMKNTHVENNEKNLINEPLVSTSDGGDIRNHSNNTNNNKTDHLISSAFYLGFPGMQAPSGITPCQDTSEAVELCRSRGLYLKPLARVNITVSLPDLPPDSSCAISNWEIMEKLRAMIKPDTFSQLKVAKSTLQSIKFEADLESQSLLNKVKNQLDKHDLKLSGFPCCLKLHAAEAKIPYPTRHDWDSFFRDAKNMNELKPGERPDTVHISCLPCRWFTQDRKAATRESEAKPSETVLKKVFEVFGSIRCVDIPILDPINSYREDTLNVSPTNLSFDAFIQFCEYVAFVRCMEALRNMRLMYFDEERDEAFTVLIRVDFDRTKHLSDRSVRKRRLLRERILELEKKKHEELEEEKRRKEAEDIEREKVRLYELETIEKRRAEREQRRKEKAEERKRLEEERLMKQKIALEERKILVAMRKLETIRLLCELLRRAKLDREREEVRRREVELEEERRKQVEAERRKRMEKEREKIKADAQKKAQLARQERELREKILKKVNLLESNEKEALRRRLKKARLKSAVLLEQSNEDD